MVHMYQKTVTGFLLGLCLLIGLAPDVLCQSASDQRPSGNSTGETGDKKASDSFYAMSADEFFNQDRVQRPIDMQNINHTLLSAAVFYATNNQRAGQNLARLEHLPPLDEASRTHSANMAEGGYLSHVNPNDPQQRTLSDRVELVGLNPRFAAENVATHFGIEYKSGEPVYPVEQDGEKQFRYSPQGPPIPNHTYQSFAQTLVERWMDSPEHRKNILAKKAEFLGNGCTHTRDKAGMDTFYCTQVFFAPLR